jgi:chromate reductase
MADQLNVLVICGSLRKGSYNAALTRALPALAPPEMKLVMAPTIGTFPLYNADIQDGSVRLMACCL